MDTWLLFLIGNLLPFCIASSSSDSINAVDGEEWWMFETQLDREARQNYFSELVETLKSITNIESLSEEELQNIEWKSLMLSREYLHLSTNLQPLADKVENLRQFLSSGKNIVEIFQNDQHDLILKSFLVIMMKTRETMMEILKYHLNYQLDSARQVKLSNECEKILEALNASHKDHYSFQILVREVLMWKGNFEQRHDDLIESINAYNVDAGSWLYNTFLLESGYYPGDDVENDTIGDVVADPEDAVEVLEAAREMVRVYQEVLSTRDNETLQMDQHSEL